MYRIANELRYAVRSVRKSPAFSLSVIAVLALAIAANTAIFSIVYGVLLRPLPYHDPDSLAVLWATVPKKGISADWTSYPTFRDWAAQSRSFSDIAAVLRIDTATLTGLDEPRTVKAGRVSANLFSMLGVPAALGRVYSTQEDKRAEPVVVLSRALWMAQFGGPHDVIGNKIEIDHKPATIVGVMPAGFAFPDPSTQLWIPLSFTAQWSAFLTARQADAFRAVARLKPGVTVGQAQAEMDSIAAQLARQHPDTDGEKGVSVVALSREIAGPKLRRALWLLLGAVGMVLLIACANAASLLLARGAGRRREFAVRTALGASRERIIAQLLAESLVLAVAAGLIGFALAAGAIRVIPLLIPPDLPRIVEVHINAAMLAFTLLLSVVTALCFGLIPALQVSRPESHNALKGGRAETGSASRTRARNAIVAAEFALAVVLLIGAGLLVRSFIRLQNVDLGFRPDRVLIASIELPGWRSGLYPDPAGFFDRALGRTRALPDVAAAGAISGMLTDYVPSTNVTLEQETATSVRQQSAPSTRSVVNGDYFQAAGIPLMNGRFFDSHDGPQTPAVAIINQTMARRFWPGRDAIGQRFRFGVPGENNPTLLTVVGIVGDTLPFGPESRAIATFYVPHGQAPWTGSMDLIVRTRSHPGNLAAVLRGEIRAVDPSVPRFEITILQRRLEEIGWSRRFETTLLGLFSLAALVLACAGTYGLVRFVVAQRTPEIGVRIALGASAGDVLWMIVRQGVSPALIGLGMGLVAAVWLARLLGHFLYDVSPADPLTLATVCTLLIAVAAAASYLPARAASRLDPSEALRYE